VDTFTDLAPIAHPWRRRATLRTMLGMGHVRRVDWRVAAGAAVLLTILFGLQQWAAQATARRDLDLPKSMTLQAVTWGAWLLLLPLMVRTAARHPLDGRPTARWLLLTIAEGVAFVLAHAAIAGTGRWALGLAVSSQLGTVLTNTVNAGFASNAMRYCGMLAIYQAVVYHDAVRERDQRAARLELDLAQARLANVEACLRPHFLFNTLNAIAALVCEDPRAAERTIGELSDLLRASLYAEPSREVRLDEELAFTEKYLGLERVRFQDRLRVSFEISAEARCALVPHLLLQPLVENAIRHGIAPLEAGGTIAVAAARRNGILHVTVRDDGVGVHSPAATHGSGIGLRGLRARLAHLYGDDHRLVLRPGPTGGAVVDVELPYRSAAS
jgi:two-component system, LytTR family, sensor kinase